MTVAEYGAWSARGSMSKLTVMVTVMNSLTIGRKCRNGEIVAQGVMTQDKSIECLLLVQSLFSEDPAFTEIVAELFVLPSIFLFQHR